MTVSSATATATYTGNGTTTAFTVPFHFLVDGDVKISQKSAATGAVSVLTLGTDYSLTGAGSTSGGTATLVTAPATGDTIYIERNVPEVQETSYPEGGPFPAASHEKAMDRLTMIAQQNTTAINLKLGKGALDNFYDAGSNKISSMADGVAATDAATKGQMDIAIAAALTGTTGTDIALYSVLASTVNGEGPAKIGFKSPLANSIARTLYGVAQDYYPVTNWCAFDGTTDDTTQFQNAINALAGIGHPVALMLPPGKIKLGAITLAANVSIYGAGKFATSIIPTTASQTCFTLAGAGARVNATYRDFQIDCGTVTGVTGFSLSNCQDVDLENIAFVACAMNFVFDRGRGYRVSKCDSAGNPAQGAGACKVWSSSDIDYIFEVSITDYRINNIGNGVRTDTIYLRRGIGCQFSGIYCNDAYTGGAATFLLIENDCQGCKIERLYVGSCDIGIQMQNGTGPIVGPSFCDLISCDVDQAHTYAANLFYTTNSRFIGGNITDSGAGTALYGVQVNSSCSNLSFNGVNFNGYSALGKACLYLFGCSHINILNCLFENSYYALAFGSSPTNITGFGNTLQSCTNKYNGAIGGTGNWFQNNANFNPFTITAPTLPASGVTYTNTLGCAARVYIQGGTFTAVSINGNSITASGSFQTEVLPGDTIAVTYSVAPAWTWIGL